MPGELAALKASAHRPNFVLSVLSSAVEQARMPNAARVRCDVNLTSFADVVGGSERILKTPIPLSYTRRGHSHPRPPLTAAALRMQTVLAPPVAKRQPSRLQVEPIAKPQCNIHLLLHLSVDNACLLSSMTAPQAHVALPDRVHHLPAIHLVVRAFVVRQCRRLAARNGRSSVFSFLLPALCGVRSSNVRTSRVPREFFGMVLCFLQVFMWVGDPACFCCHCLPAAGNRGEPVQHFLQAFRPAYCV